MVCSEKFGFILSHSLVMLIRWEENMRRLTSHLLWCSPAGLTHGPEELLWSCGMLQAEPQQAWESCLVFSFWWYLWEQHCFQHL